MVNKRKLNGVSLFDVVNCIIMILLAIITLYPFWYIISVSLTGYSEYISTKFLLYPKGITFDAYSVILKEASLYRSFFLTVSVVVLYVFLHVMMCLITAYPLSKKYLPGRNFMLAIVVIPMVFSGGMIPLYLVVKSLGLMNKYAILILMGMFSAYNTVLMKNFMTQIPDALEEAAKIDGANDYYILFRIYIPMSMPIIATIALFAAVGKWNDYTTALYYISKESLYPIQNVLRSMLVENSIDTVSGGFGQADAFKLQTSAKMAAVVVATIPVVAVYPFVQKYFVKGIMLGSVKG